MADSLTLSIRNFLAQKHDLTALLGSDSKWDTWIFADEPFAKIERTGRSMVVITKEGGWTAPNEHNTMKFPRVYVDVWSDPDRNRDGSVKRNNARNKIDAVHDAIAQYLHTVSMHSNGRFLCWGNREQMDTMTGLIVLGSVRQNEPDYSPVADGNGAWMGRVSYGINLP
jgi:hypothetical protein